MWIDNILAPIRSLVFTKESQVSKKLDRYIQKVAKVFDISELISEDQSSSKVYTYYKKSFWAYRIFNTDENYIHFSFSDQNYVKKTDYLGPIKEVEKVLKKINAKRVLELASGKGANLGYLNKKYSEVEFHGLDLNQTPLERYKKANTTFSKGDFHNLIRYEDNSFDLIFIIEGLCYSENKGLFFKEVKKKLKKGGYLVISDGYRTVDWKDISKEEQIAIKLVERGMALNSIEYLPALKSQVENVNLALVEEKDFTKEVVPNLRKFEFLARSFFKFPSFAKLMIKLFSKDFAKNSLSGLFMGSMLDSGNGGYYVHIIKKR